MSALSNGGQGNTCNTIGMTGTSMAAPSAAASGLLVRQYFADSRFWYNKCNRSYQLCKVFTPSGVLVKAMLLHSGSAMSLFNGQDGGKSDISLGSPPDNTQGFGRIDLMNALPLTNYNGFDLFVDDLVPISENVDINYVAVITNSKLPLK